MAILKAGTYVFKAVPALASSLVSSKFTYKTYDLSNNDIYKTEPSTYRFMGSNTQSSDTKNIAIVRMTTSPGATEWSEKTYEAERGWYRFYYNGDFDSVTDRYTATDTTKFRTIIVESDQTVDDAFYTWFMTNIEKPQVNIDLTTLSGYESLAAGTYALAVKSKAANYQDSDLSQTVSFTKLAAPVVTAADTTVTWDAVTNAESYDVYVDGELYENTTGGTSAYQVTVNITGTSGYVDPNGVKIYQSDEIPDGDPQVTGALVPGAEQLGVVKMGESSIFTITKKYIILDDTGGSWYGNLDPSTGITHVYGLGCCYFAVTADGTVSVDFYCLTADTLITLADGSQKRIDQLTLNDKVLSYNHETLQLETDEITYTDATENKSFTEYDRWTFADGTIVKTVHRHRFYNVERQAMVYMDEWKIGEHTITIDGKKIALVNHETIVEDVRHYTIFTKNQNYFANGLLSGNRYTKPLTL